MRHLPADGVGRAFVMNRRLSASSMPFRTVWLASRSAATSSEKDHGRHAAREHGGRTQARRSDLSHRRPAISNRNETPRAPRAASFGYPGWSLWIDPGRLMIALGLFVQLRLPATPKACAGDMLVRRDRRCGALCGASAASVNAPFFFSEPRHPCASSCRRGFYAPESFVARPSSGWQFNVSRPHSVLMLSVKPFPMCCGCVNRNRTPGSCFTASARRTHARSRFSSPDRGMSFTPPRPGHEPDVCSQAQLFGSQLAS
ncbi:hypothetical protein ABH995_000718 [Bradyrhizobium yuanmingense]